MKSRSLDLANTCYTTVPADPCRLLLISLIPIFSPIPALACLRSTWQYITQVLSMSSGDPVLSPSEDSFCTATSMFLESLYDERDLYFHFWL